MAKEPLADFLDSLINKHIEYGTFARNPENIIIGETLTGLVQKSDDYFPRIEILITKLKGDGFIDQRNMNQSFRISQAGYIRRKENVTIPQDMFDAIRWGREFLKILYMFHDDRVSGIFPCDGFIQISGYPEVFFEYEMFPKITSVVVEAEAEIQLADNYTNN